MQIHHATRLMREVCALRHLSINTENSYLHWLGRYASKPGLQRPPRLAIITKKVMAKFKSPGDLDFLFGYPAERF